MNLVGKNSLHVGDSLNILIKTAIISLEDIESSPQKDKYQPVVKAINRLILSVNFNSGGRL